MLGTCKRRDAPPSSYQCPRKQLESKTFNQRAHVLAANSSWIVPMQATLRLLRSIARVDFKCYISTNEHFSRHRYVSPSTSSVTGSGSGSGRRGRVACKHFFAIFSTIGDQGEHFTPNILLRGETHALDLPRGSGLSVVGVILPRWHAFEASFGWLLFWVAPYFASACIPGRRELPTPAFLVGGESPSLEKAREIYLVLMRVILVS